MFQSYSILEFFLHYRKPSQSRQIIEGQGVVLYLCNLLYYREVWCSLHKSFFFKPVWSLLIIFGRTLRTRLAMDLAYILQSQLRSVIGLQFFKKWADLFFFQGTRVINPLLWVIEGRFHMHNLVRLEDNDVCLSRKPCKIRLGGRHFQGFCLLALISGFVNIQLRSRG